MSKLLLVALLIVHGLIHVVGVSRAFGWGEVSESVRPISRTWGIPWALCAVALMLAAGARAAGAGWWWMVAGPALVVSQVTIGAFWTEARFGTVINVVVAVAVLLAFGSWRFQIHNRAAVARLQAGADSGAAAVVEPSELAGLPVVTARWLERSGIVGRPRSARVALLQRGQMQTSPESAWLQFRSEQWVAVDRPSFVWTVHVRGPLGLDLVGRDTYLGGRGSMHIELLSVIPVVDEDGPTIDQGALVRFLAEMMWYPSAALAPYIHWQAVDDRSARANAAVGGVEVTGVFRFDAVGDVVGFEARRYREDLLEDWLVTNDPTSFRELDGVRIPTRSTITWRDKHSREWTWLEIEVVDAARNGSLTRLTSAAGGTQ